MSRTGWWVAFGLTLGAAVTAVLDAPATLIPWLLDKGHVSVLQLTDVQDSLWSGSASVALTAPGAAPRSLGRWHWALGFGPWLQPELRLASLVVGAGTPAAAAPVAAMALPPWSGSLNLTPGLRTLALREVHLQSPAEALPDAIPALRLLQPRGQVALSADALQIGFDGLHGEVTLEWHDAVIAQSPVAPLGNWQARCLLDGTEGHYQLRTLNGPLTVQGDGQVALDGRFSLQGFVQSDALHRVTLQPLLGLLGAPDDSGRVAIALPWRAAATPVPDGSGR